ncbi:MAG: hypothetical protein AB1609_08370, partial [Bacillota bacterium]
AVAFAVEQLGFHAWMVGVNGTHHYAEDLLEIAAPWEFAQDPPDAGAEKVRLYRLTREAKPLFRSLAPRDLREKMAGLPAPLSLEDLARALASHLPGGPDSPAARLALAWRLNTSPECFERVELEPGRAAYRAREQAPDGPAAEEAADGRVEQNAALAEAERLFPPDTGLYRKGADPQSGTITLYFHFPQVAEKKWQDRIAQLEAVTGWSVRVHPEAHMGVLAEAARRVLPEDWVLLRNPSVDRDRRVVTVRCQVPDGATEEDFATARSHFREETGFDLELDGRGVPWLDAAAAADPHSGPAAASRMEINQAFAAVRAGLAAAGATVYRVGRKTGPGGDYIEVSFISPALAERFRQPMEELSRQTGWPLEPNPEPNQHEIKAIARSLIPPEWGLKREPAFFRERMALRVSLTSPPSVSDPGWVEVADRFTELTGCTMELG